MALIMHVGSLLLNVILFQCREGDAFFMWNAPPPAWNQTIPGANAMANIQTAVLQVPNGSTNVPLRWSYNLLNWQSISITIFSIRYGNDLPDQNIYVVRGGTATYDKSRFSIDSTSEYSTLTIKTVTKRENATYQCRIVLTDGTEWAYDIRLDVSVPLEITHISEDITMSKGDLVTLICTAVGSPRPNITWTRLSDNSVVTMPLKISGEKDEGSYRCTADNGFGNSVTRDVFISLSNPPKIIRPQTATWKIMAGETFTIECLATGGPNLQYEWTNAEGRIVASEKYLRLDNVGDSAAGNYMCTAKNSLGSDSFTVTIQVIESTASSRNLSVATSNTPVPQRRKESITSSSDTPWHILIGIALGGLVVLTAVIGLAVWCRRKANKSGQEKHCSKNDQEQEDVDHGIPRYVDVESFHDKKMVKANRHTDV